MIVDLVMQRPPETVTLRCLAPLTNIALAIAKEPRLAAHCKEIVLMGGAFSEGGNITPAAEFNIYVDPEAAQRVFTSGANLTMIPLDCTHLARTTAERLNRLRAIGTPVSEAFFHLLRHNKMFDEAKYGWDGGPLHDATVIAYLLRPEIFGSHRVHVAVECASELTLGMTVVDWWGVTGKTANALVLREKRRNCVFRFDLGSAGPSLTTHVGEFSAPVYSCSRLSAPVLLQRGRECRGSSISSAQTLASLSLD